MRQALVSVLVPCYNAGRWVGETLDSVLAQTYRPLEIIVVDDGSTDDSAAVLERYAKQGVTVIRQENRGQTAALNRALELARGDFVQYLDADDLLHPAKVELQVARLQNRTRAVAMAEWARFRTTPQEAQFVPDRCWQDLDPVSWLVEAWEAGGGMLFPAMWLLPRPVVEQAGPWNEHLTLNNDAEYFTRALLAAEEVLFTAGARCYYRSGLPGSLSGRKSRAAWESQFLVMALCESYLRRREDSDRTRRACAVVWQVIAHACYPYAPDIANHALARARALHPVERRPEGGRAFRVVSRLVGWKLARRLQRWSGRP
jgi:glycosyltransferase involved in cell wall biosynthesis